MFAISSNRLWVLEGGQMSPSVKPLLRIVKNRINLKKLQPSKAIIASGMSHRKSDAFIKSTSRIESSINPSRLPDGEPLMGKP